MKRMPNVLKRLLISTTLALMIGTLTPSFEPASKPLAADSVYVSVENLESLYAGVDSLLLERRLLQINLKEVRGRAHIDSVLFAERLALRDAQKESWLVRALKHPAMDAVYFVAGVYIGAQAISHVR